MKKVLAILLAALLLFSLTACGEDAKTPETEPVTEEAVTEEAEPAEAAEDVTAEEEPEEAPEEEAEAPEEAEAEEEAEEEAPEEEPAAETSEAEEAPEEEAGAEETEAYVDYSAKSEGVMTYAEYAAAALDDEVTVEVFVQAHQSWWQDKVTVYAADPDGAYFIYELACSEEDAEKLVPGTKIKVNGYKAEWSGEVEIADATFEFCEEGSGYIAFPTDVTALLGTDDLELYMNDYVTFTGLTVAPSKDADGNELPYLYNWDGSGEPGNDLYFNVEVNGSVYTFTVESYLCGQDTEVYQAVEGLEIGEVINAMGFLYWYEGPNPHITTVIDASDLPIAKSEGVMSWFEYNEAEIDSEVTIEAYVMDTQSWWEDKITVYAEDPYGAYFIYNMACSEEDAENLTPGTKIKVTGYKAEWSGEVEIADATFEFVDDDSSAFNSVLPVDVTRLLGKDALAKYMNRYVGFSNVTVVPSKDADGNELPFLYNWDGSGAPGNDLYFTVKAGEGEYSFVVESYLRGEDTDVYKAVEALEIGDVLNLSGYLYWYEGPNPHIISVEVLTSAAE